MKISHIIVVIITVIFIIGLLPIIPVLLDSNLDLSNIEMSQTQKDNPLYQATKQTNPTYTGTTNEILAQIAEDCDTTKYTAKECIDAYIESN
jgi:hypothetical protein